MSFEYIKGKVYSRKKWTRPSYSKFYKWYEEFLKLKGIENYSIWLSGGFCLDPTNTWDIDITLVGKIIDYEELSNIMIMGTQRGLDKFRILLDIQHHNIPPNIVYSKNTKNKKIIKTVFFNKIIKNKKIITDWREAKKISENLWEIEMDTPSIKHKKLIESGHIFAQPICLKE